ncbi:response regulator transcription factor [Singulisphaera sp. PoT]|uniref:response regulator transcription factor n=1 Tax=Singulisphaera sp. PoT TaxID=3411797 RepID=UPI003BF5B3D0
MKVLIVEDEVDLGRGLWLALEEDGYSVDLVRDGETALHQARNGSYDAMVLDLMLPRLDGWSVLRNLREDEAKTPVLMLTARDSVADRVRGLDEGADDYLTKPFEIEELLARLRALIRRAAGQPTPRLRLGDVVVDTVAGIVRKNGQAVDLTAKEYALVEFLARNRGKLMSRSTIYEHIYADDDETLSNVLDVYVSNLRRKLGKEFITTRRGQGYIVDV